MENLFKINGEDNVAVALEGHGDIPAGHKVALCDIKKGDSVIKYGYPIGYAIVNIKKGDQVHTHNLKTLLSEGSTYHYNPKIVQEYKKGAALLKEKWMNTVPSINVYTRENDKIGIRNELWIVPTVGCVNSIATELKTWAEKEFTGIDGVHAWTHPFGCSQLGDDHENTRKILADLVKHPNAGGVLVLGLGCENNTMPEFKKLVGDVDESRIKFLVSQDVEDEVATSKELLRSIYSVMKNDKREEAPLSKLTVGFKCGGSDGFSGITANALVGRFCDVLTTVGGKAVLTEVPEMFGAEQILMDRCENENVYNDTVDLINNFKEYFVKHEQVVYENPSPGNKAGGISTLEDKSLGCVQKGGKSIITDVIKYGETVRKSGLTLLEGPGNDLVSTTAQSAAGVNLILFTTGRGTPFGSSVPTLKIASNHALAVKKSNWIDLDSSLVLNDGFEEVTKRLIDLIVKTANGEYLVKNEKSGYAEISIFKDGVVL
jgi:altronate hydrolase